LRLGGQKDELVGAFPAVTGIISAVAFSFIVHDPNGIMDVVSDKSFSLQTVHVAQSSV